MFAVSFLYFSLEAIKTMHITKLQTFSTGNRTLKREVYFITLLKNHKVIRKPKEVVASPKMDSNDYRNKFLYYDITSTVCI